MLSVHKVHTNRREKGYDSRENYIETKNQKWGGNSSSNWRHPDGTKLDDENQAGGATRNDSARRDSATTKSLKNSFGKSKYSMF